MVVANRSCGEDEYQTWPEWGMLTLAVSDSSEIKHRSFWRAWKTKKPTKIDRLSLQPTCSTSPGFVGTVAVIEAMFVVDVTETMVFWHCCCYWTPGFVGAVVVTEALGLFAVAATEAMDLLVFLLLLKPIFSSWAELGLSPQEIIILIKCGRDSHLNRCIH